MSELTPYYQDDRTTIYHGDALEVLSLMGPETVNCCVTSPPYWGLRDYGYDEQIGLEPTPEAYVETIVSVFREVRRVLRDDGTLWLNIGDSYTSGNRIGHGTRVGNKQETNAGCLTTKDRRPPVPNGMKSKDLVGIPWMVAFALRADGWYLRQDIIWHKPNPMPESVKDRCTKSHEYVFLLSKSERYYYDAEAIAVNGSRKRTGNPTGETCNRRTVWTVNTKPYPGAHFAVFPPNLIEPCILAGCSEGGTVLDPFGGSGTTAEVARKNGCNSILIELNEEYIQLAANRLRQKVLF